MDFITWMYGNSKLIVELEDVLEKLQPSSLVGDVCQVLHRFYKSDNTALRNFVVQLIPAILSSFFIHSSGVNSVARSKRLVAAGGGTGGGDGGCDYELGVLESCLLGMCSQSLFRQLRRTGSSQASLDSLASLPGSASLQIPALTDASSVFHDAVAYQKSLSLKPTMTSPPYQHKLSLAGGLPGPKTPMQPRNSPGFGLSDMASPTQNRLSVAACLLGVYTEAITGDAFGLDHTVSPSPHSLLRYCQVAARLASLRHRPRVQVTDALLGHLLRGVDAIVFFYSRLPAIPVGGGDGQTTLKIYRKAAGDTCREAFRAVNLLEQRAAFECLPGALLACDAVRRCWSLRPSVIGVDVPDEYAAASTLQPGTAAPLARRAAVGGPTSVLEASIGEIADSLMLAQPGLVVDPIATTTTAGVISLAGLPEGGGGGGGDTSLATSAAGVSVNGAGGETTPASTVPRRSRQRQLSNVEVITNATFTTKVVPEDITPDGEEASPTPVPPTSGSGDKQHASGGGDKHHAAGGGGGSASEKHHTGRLKAVLMHTDSHRSSSARQSVNFGKTTASHNVLSDVPEQDSSEVYEVPSVAVLGGGGRPTGMEKKASFHFHLGKRISSAGKTASGLSSTSGGRSSAPHGAGAGIEMKSLHSDGRSTGGLAVSTPLGRMVRMASRDKEANHPEPTPTDRPVSPASDSDIS